MDMSIFHRARSRGSRTELSLLLAQLAAGQALTPTAKAAVQRRDDSKQRAVLNPLLRQIAEFSPIVDSPASFNGLAAQTLLTSGQSS